MAGDTTLTLRRITREDAPLWDHLVRSSPQGSIFQLDEFLGLWVKSEPRLHSLRFGCFDETGRLLAGQVFLYREKALGLRVQTCLNFPYNSSPILAGSIRHDAPEYAVILQLLARKANRLFPLFCFECHPSLSDVRPFLEIGWRAVPEYAHTCDLGDLAALLGDKNRFRRASRGLGRYDFADETTHEIAAQFPALYRKSAVNYGLELGRAWEATFSARMDWMLHHGVAHCYTCRKKDGALLGIMICVLSRPQQVAHPWMMAFDLSLGEKDFVRSLYLYAIKQLAEHAIHVDIAEGIRPAIYDFKDSLGTDSTMYFMVESPRTDFYRKVFTTYRSLRRVIARRNH